MSRFVKGTSIVEWVSQYNIQYLQKESDIIEYIKTVPNLLFITRCSKTKTMKTGTPKEFYVSSQNLKFYAWCEKYHKDYAVLSDLYGLHFFDEVLDYYNIHPGKLSLEEKQKLGGVVKNKIKERNYSNLLFCASPPLMQKPYFEMLSFSGIPTIYVSKLPALKERRKLF